jgi:hypothetical protein
MTEKRKSSLPPRPTITFAALEKRANSFAEVDRIMSEQLVKHRNSDRLALYMTKAGTSDRLFYARRCILFAGLSAWQRANEWERERPIVQANVKQIVEQVQTIKRANDKLRRIAQKITEQATAHPIVADPTILTERSEYFGTFDTLLQATDRIETFAYDDLNSVVESVLARDYGRKDVLADQFIANVAGIWKLFFGEQPPTAASGAFVALTEAAWTALGWDDRPIGKKVLRKATEEFWSQLKQLDRHSAGTI